MKTCYRLLARVLFLAAATMTMLALGSSFAQTLNNTINLGRNPVGTVTYHGAGPGGEAYEINGGGRDVWDDYDECTYAYHEFAGDFDVKVQVVSLQPTARWTRAGIMVRESLAEDSRMVFMHVTPPNVPTGNGGNGANDVVLAYRTGIPRSAGDNGGQHEDGIGLAPAYPNAWIRLTRVGSVFTGYGGNDGVNWTQLARQDTAFWVYPSGGASSPFADRVKLGLAVSPYNGSIPTANCIFTNYMESTARFCLGAADSLGCPDRITVYFNRPVGASAVDSRKYSISGGVFIYEAKPGPTPNTVVLLTDVLSEGSDYTVTLIDPTLIDAGGSTIDAGCVAATFTHAKGYELRAIHVLHNQIGDGSTGPILASQAYKLGIGTPTLDRPGTEDGNAGFFEDSLPDSGSNERFATRTMGVLLVPADGYYAFACSSDENSKMYLSTDDQPANKRLIGYEPQWNGSRAYGTTTRRNGAAQQENNSGPIALKGGGHYYIELLAGEGTGGNNSSATWDAGTGVRFVDGQNPMDSTLFLPSRFARGHIFYNLGAASLLSEPTDVALPVGLTADFTVTLDGTPPYTLHWKTNGISVPGANSSTLSISNVQESMNQMQVSVCVSNACGGACSTNATLTVLANPIVLNCSSRGNGHAFYVTYNKAMNLDGTYSVSCSNANGAVTTPAVSTIGYGENQKVIVVKVTPDLLPDTNTYCVTIQGAHAQEGRMINPNPAVCCFVYGQEYQRFHIIDNKWDHVFNNNVVDNFMSSAHYLSDPPDHTYSDHTVPAFTAFETPWQSMDTDYYGDEGLGFWIVPQTGNYYFWCASDNGSKVFMATDAIPAHKVLICQDPYWSDYRAWAENGGGPNNSLENGFTNGIPLTHNQLVYLQVDHVNGIEEGLFVIDPLRDHWAVTYKINDSTPPTSGTPSAFRVDQFRPSRLAPNGQVFWMLGDMFCNPGPSDQTVYVAQSATFSVAPEGTPPYTLQWQSNGVAMVGAVAAFYTTAPVSEANDGDIYTATISNAFSTNSCSAVLHVPHNPIVVSAWTRNDPNHIYVIYNKPVALNAANYSLDAGSLLVHGAAYGSSSSEIVLATDPILADTTHLLKIAGVVDLETPPNPVVSNPTNLIVEQALGRFCTDFNAGLPPGTISTGWFPPYPYVGSDDALHLTDLGGGEPNFWIIPLAQSETLQSFKANWRQLLAGLGGGGGTSFNVGQNIGTGFAAEEGASDGLSVTVDTFDTGGHEVGIKIRWNGAPLSITLIGDGVDNGPPELMRGVFVDASVEVTLSGFATFKYDTFVTAAQIPNYHGIKANMYVFAGSARFGGKYVTGFSETAEIDDVCFNDYALGPMSVKVDPPAATVNECSSPTLSSSTTTGSPPFYYQWYKNEVAIPGATGPTFTTPPLLRADNGTVYKLVVTNLFSSGSYPAVVAVAPDNVPPHLVSALICPTINNVTVTFDKVLEPASAGTPANYSINGGVAVSGALLKSDGKTVLLAVSGMVNGNCYTLKVSNVADACPGNVIVAASSVVVTTVPQAGGPNNLVVVECEKYDAKFSSSPDTIHYDFDNTFPSYSGTGYMIASGYPPSVNVGNGPSLSPSLYLDYCIDFPVAGNYYFWLRGGTGNSDGSANSCHISLDGADPNANENNRIDNSINDWGGACPAGTLSFGWVHNSAVTGAGSYVTVPTSGVHAFRIWMRENGLKMDQFALTTDPAFSLDPCAAPLPPTPRAGPQLRIRLDTKGQVVLTWDSAGCTLQGSSVLGGSPTNWHAVAASSPFTINGPTGNTFYRLIFP